MNKKRKITKEIKKIALYEDMSPISLIEKINEGKIVIPDNPIHKKVRPCAIGDGLRVKINANIGTSISNCDVKEELRKLAVAQRAGADTVMDLSTGGDIGKIRRRILKRSYVPVGTVPIYEAAVLVIKRRGDIKYLTEEMLFKVFEEQAADGGDFFTIHCGITRETIKRLKLENRIIDVVSRGGAFLTRWIESNKRENPLYENFDEILKIAKKYDVALSLGDGLRPGSIVDSTDRPQVQELVILGELCRKARSYGVQVMIEGPGHIPIQDIEANIRLEKTLCDGAPFYVLGPLVTDSACGYDHISAAIGGALAAWHGADFLCYVTPSEHLGLPSVDDVREGVMASRVAAYAADIARGLPYALKRERDMSIARGQRDWIKMRKLSIDTDKPWRDRKDSLKESCSMCDEYCPIKLLEKKK